MHVLYSILILLSFCFNLYSQNYNNILVTPSDEIQSQTSNSSKDFKTKQLVFEESMNVQKNPRNTLMYGTVPNNRLAALLILGDLCEKGTQTKADTDAILYSIKNEGVINVKAMAITYYGFCMHNDTVDSTLYGFIKQGTAFSSYNSASQILSFIGTGGLASLLNIDIPTPGASDATTLFLGAVRGLIASSTAKSTLLLMALNKYYIDARTLRTNYSPDSFLGKIQIAILEGIYEKALYGDVIAEKYLQAQMKLSKGTNYTKLSNPYYDETSKVTSTFLIAKLNGKEALPYLNAIGNSGFSNSNLKGECAYWADQIDPRPSTTVYTAGTATSYRTVTKPNYTKQYHVTLFKQLEQDQANGVAFVKFVVLWIAMDGLCELVGPTVKAVLNTVSKEAVETELGTIADLTAPSAIKTLVSGSVKTANIDSKLASINVTKSLANQAAEDAVFVDSKAVVGNVSKNATNDLVVDAFDNPESGISINPNEGFGSPSKTTPNINPSGGYTDVAVKSNVSITPKVVIENPVFISPNTLTPIPKTIANSTPNVVKNSVAATTAENVGTLTLTKKTSPLKPVPQITQQPMKYYSEDGKVYIETAPGIYVEEHDVNKTEYQLINGIMVPLTSLLSLEKLNNDDSYFPKFATVTNKQLLQLCEFVGDNNIHLWTGSDISLKDPDIYDSEAEKKYKLNRIDFYKNSINREAISDEVGEGIYLSFSGSEKVLITASITKATHLLMLDKHPNVVLYNRIKIGLISISNNMEDLRHLILKASYQEWCKRTNEYTGIMPDIIREALTTKLLYDFFTKTARDKESIGMYDLLTNHGKRSPFYRTNYHFNQPQYNRLKFMTNRGRISAELLLPALYRGSIFHSSTVFEEIAKNIKSNGLRIAAFDIGSEWSNDDENSCLFVRNLFDDYGGAYYCNADPFRKVINSLNEGTDSNSLLILNASNDIYVAFHWDYLTNNMDVIEVLPNILAYSRLNHNIVEGINIDWKNHSTFIDIPLVPSDESKLDKYFNHLTRLRKQ